MQLIKPHSTQEMSGHAQNSLAALKAAEPQENAIKPKEAATPNFDETLTALLSTLRGDNEHPQMSKAAQKMLADKPEPEKKSETDDSSALAVLETLLAAHQHPVSSATLPKAGDEAEAKIGEVMLQSRTPTAPSPLTANTLQAGAADKDPGSEAADNKDTTGNGVKLVMTQPVAASTQEMVMLQSSQTPPVSSEIAAVPSLPEQSDTAASGIATYQRLPDVKLSGESSRWSEQLHSALGDRLQVQVKDQIQHATIRLDPPNMGKIDITMELENGRMQVHINANHGEVYRALQQVSHDLRQSLIEQNFVQVNVQVSSQHPGQQQEQRHSTWHAQNEAVMANPGQAEEDSYSSHQDDESVLLTV